MEFVLIILLFLAFWTSVLLVIADFIHLRVKGKPLLGRIGRSIHRYYGFFNHKWVADLIYILMKPLEWLFLLTLYIFDRTPENRIAQQYMHKSDRQKIQQDWQG